MNEEFGIARVLEPRHAMPTSAWKLDNNRALREDELCVEIKTIHLDGTSFHQICLESNDNDELIKRKIIDIVIRRGKLHNPVTDTGGLAYGVVAEIGPKYKNKIGLQRGEEIICNASLASMPLYISEIKSIDRVYNQVEVEGYAIVYGSFPLVRRPKNLPVNLLLYVFNESGTLYRTWTESKDKTNFMVVGNNLMMNLIYGHTIRKAVGERANIVCVLDKKSNVIMKSEKLDSLAEKTFNALHYVNILRPLEAKSNLGEEAMFDMSVNCAEIPGAETLNILATRYGGTVVFANLINNYNLALYVTEALSRQLNIRCADGYLAKYDEFDIDIITDLVPYFEGVKIASIRNNASIEKAMKTRGKERVRADDFISGSPAMEAVLEEIMSVAKYDCNVLITGDTGVGKEKVANLIVKNSMRSMQPLIKLNCAAIAPNLMESEFFGYEAGAFTGAKDKGKKGYFETADNGTVFLDEVGEMPLDIQAKLLRVIQDGEFFRVGGAKPIKTNVRIIAATNRDLLTRVEEKEFRRDLYYRLNVFQIKVPSLRERREDIPPLVQYFLKKYGEKFNVKRGIDEDALELLVQSDWKGNIRELENVVQRLLIGARSENITLIEVGKELHRELFETPKLAQIEEGTEGLNLEKMVEDFERQIIKYACEKYGSTRKAAKAIGISQTQLVRKKNKYEI